MGILLSRFRVDRKVLISIKIFINNKLFRYGMAMHQAEETRNFLINTLEIEPEEWQTSFE